MNKKYRIAFVFIVEHGDLEYKSLLLGESLRRIFPDGSVCPIYAIRPRKGKEISEATIKKFKELSINYIYEPENIIWRNLPFANEAYGSALIEDKVKDEVEILVYLDADIVCLKYPEQLFMDENIKVLVSPVDVNWTGGIKYGEELTPNWIFSYKLNNIDPKKLWPVCTKVEKDKIYPYFNSGLIAVRPELGIFKRWKDMFEMSAKFGYFGMFSPLSKEFGFTDQVFLSSIIISMFKQDEIGILDDSYNFPVNIAGEGIFKTRGKIDFDSITFLHYHHSFYDMKWTKFFNLNDADFSWLFSKLPLHKDLKSARYRKKREYVAQYINYFYWRFKLKFGSFNKGEKPKD